MSVSYTIHRTDGTEERGTCDKPQDYKILSACIKKAIGVDEIERVRCLVNFELTDMFCDEMGHIRAETKPRNRWATEAYQALATRNGYDTDHWIPGDVIVFDKPVWDDVE